MNIIHDQYRLLERIHNNPHDYPTMLILADCLEEQGRLETAEAWRWIGTRERSPILISTGYRNYWMWEKVYTPNWQRMGCNALPPGKFNLLNGGRYFDLQCGYPTIAEAFADLISVLQRNRGEKEMKVEAIRDDESNSPVYKISVYKDRNGNWYASMKINRDGLTVYCTATYTSPKEAIDEAWARVDR